MKEKGSRRGNLKCDVYSGRTRERFGGKIRIAPGPGRQAPKGKDIYRKGQIRKPKGTSQPILSRGINIRVMVDNVCGWSGE